jgi:thermitase
MARKLIVLLVSACALAAPAAAGAAVKTRDWQQRAQRGEALVRFERGVVASERREIRSDASVALEDVLELSRTQLVTFDGSVRAAVARLEQQPGVAYAQPNYRYHALAPVPNDVHFGHLWGLGSTPGVGVLPAWDRSRGSGQVIAIVDTGVDLTHQDLVGNLWTRPGEPGVHGRDFVDNDNDPDDFNLHGTHVAGTAAAVAENGVGVAGVAPQAQIMAVRVLDGDGSGSTSSIANGIVFAANEGAGVINLSLGGPAGGGDAAMADAISQASAKGAVVVAAAGNDSSNNDAAPVTPCVLGNTNLICVAAVTKTGARSGFSNFGVTTVDVGAPGGNGSGDPDADILSAKPSWTSVFSESFETGTGAWSGTTNKLPWGQDNGGSDGVKSAADSVGGNYQNETDSTLNKTAPVNLAGRRGCRMQFDVRLGITDVDAQGNPFDFMGVGVLSGAGNIGQNLWGDTGTAFERVEMSIYPLDGRTDITPTLRFHSDEIVVGDGGYVDNFHVDCRGQTYDDVIASDDAAAGGSYTAIAGTSMAAPHVAGVAALVRTLDPGAPPAQVVQALKNGAKPVFGMAGVTVTGGAVDAVGAMDAVLALPNPVAPPPPPPPPPPAPPSPPAKARFGSVSVNNRGVLTIRVFGNPGTSGVLTLRANIVRPSAGRLVRVARKAFRIGSLGRATVRPRLNRAALRQLRRTRRLRLRARVVLRNSAGLTSTATARLRVTLRRR